MVQGQVSFCAFAGLFSSRLELFSALMTEFLASSRPGSGQFARFPSVQTLDEPSIFLCFFALHRYTTFGMASTTGIVVILLACSQFPKTAHNTPALTP